MFGHRSLVVVAVALAVLVAGSAVSVFVLQRRVAELRSANADLTQQLEKAAGSKTAGPSESGFQDLQFADALGKARTEGKPVMAFFLSKSSGPSQGMENTTWRDATVSDWLKKRTVAIRIDADSEPDLAVGSGITGLPVTIFYRPDRTEIGRIIGYHGPVDFLQKASAIVEADKLGQKK